MADTKFEFGADAAGKLYLIDEALTPDSSRFWPADQYRVGMSPPSFDKQFVRDWLEAQKWNKQPPAPRAARRRAREDRREVPRGAAPADGQGVSAVPPATAEPAAPAAAAPAVPTPPPQPTNVVDADEADDRARGGAAAGGRGRRLSHRDGVRPRRGRRQRRRRREDLRAEGPAGDPSGHRPPCRRRRTRRVGAGDPGRRAQARRGVLARAAHADPQARRTRARRGDRRAGHRRRAHSLASGRAAAPRGVRRRDRGAVGEQVRPGEPDERAARVQRLRARGAAGAGRRGLHSGHRIDDRGFHRRAPPAPAPRRRSGRCDRGGARRAARRPPTIRPRARPARSPRTTRRARR